MWLVASCLVASFCHVFLILESEDPQHVGPAKRTLQRLLKAPDPRIRCRSCAGGHTSRSQAHAVL